MHVEQLRVSVVDTPLTIPFRPTWAPGIVQHSIRHLLVQIRTEDGVEGVAAGPCSSIGAARYLADVGAPLLIGHDVFDRIGIWRKVSAVAQEYAWPWALEVACWDAAGKIAGVPVYSLLGAAPRALPAYASFAERKELAQAIDDVTTVEQLGFHGVKLRVSLETWQEDAEIVRGVASKFAGSLKIFVDANEGSVNVGTTPFPRRQLKDVIAFARQMAECGVTWLEEPLPRHDFDALEILQSESPVPIAGGELNVGLEQFRSLIERRCYDILQPDCMFSAGIYGSHLIAGAAEVFGIDFTPHTWSNGLGLAANLHCAVASSASIVEFPFDPPGLVPETRDGILSGPLVVDSAGYLQAPTGPGLGVELDREAVERHTLATFSSGSD